jgi:hypothetical protein
MMNMSTAILTTTPTTAELSAGVQVKFPGTIKIITHV